MDTIRTEIRPAVSSRPSWVLAAILLLASGTASATEQGVELTEPSGKDEARVTAEQRPFAFLTDPSTPSAGVFTASYRFGLGSGISADRPIPVVLQNQGVSNTLALGYGITGALEAMANVSIHPGAATNSLVGDGVVGVKLQLTHPDSRWRAAVLAGALREGESRSFGAWAQATGSFSAGPVLLEANAYLEHVFAQNRDALDYLGMLGASYRVLDGLRVGAEFVGQDLEEIADPGAEGGARMGVGPDVAVDLYRGRIQLVVAALFGLNSVSPGAMARVGILGSF